MNTLSFPNYSFVQGDEFHAFFNDIYYILVGFLTYRGICL